MLKKNLAIRATYIWFISKVSIFFLSYLSLWMLSNNEASDLQFKQKIEDFWNLTIWNQWDVKWYIQIAEKGYSVSTEESNISFFPGYPMLIRFLDYLPLTTIQAGFIVSFIGGLLGVIYLNKLAFIEGDFEFTTILVWIFAPMSIFLFLPYSESLFCGFSFAAWYFGKTNKWVLAGVMSFFASTVRINGIFLAIALLVMFILSNRQSLKKSFPILLGFMPAILYFTFLKINFGSWFVWFEIQEKFWQRKFTNPIESMKNSFLRTKILEYDTSWLIQNVIEIFCVIVLLIFVLFFVQKKMWPEFVLVTLNLVAITTSTFWWTTPRSMLALIPIWLLIGRFLRSKSVLKYSYFIFSLPILTLNAIAFMMGKPVN